ncbi:DUF2092 domain-containing protein [Flavobacterium sp. N3904]|uniref:DUF2092 domain-containing protein n=1 Tax=Flavobacterium sp. N3904 TaxID=2986835 RepID=UPI002225AA35|nr:DUF2092 domain-containing protein [Flavobacterium sp. N3904]
MKRQNIFLIPFFFIAFLVGCSNTKEGAYDAKAIAAMDKLSSTIGELKSCSYSLSTDVTHSTTSGKPAEHRESDVYMKGPNKLYVFTKETGNRKGYYYNGSEIALFRFDKKTYEVLPAPDNTIAMITEAHDKYGVDFPAADFFYPSLTDDMMEHFDTIVDAGTAKIDGVLCKEINAISAKMNVFVSIDAATNLPKRLEIYYLGDEKGKSYVITFSNFISNPVLEDKIFNFAPPKEASKTTLLTQKLDN